MIGKKVRVFWPVDNSWYIGVVQEYDASTGDHLLKYEDDDTEWVKIGESNTTVPNATLPSNMMGRPSSPHHHEGGSMMLDTMTPGSPGGGGLHHTMIDNEDSPRNLSSSYNPQESTHHPSSTVSPDDKWHEERSRALGIPPYGRSSYNNNKPSSSSPYPPPPLYGAGGGYHPPPPGRPSPYGGFHHPSHVPSIGPNSYGGGYPSHLGMHGGPGGMNGGGGPPLADGGQYNNHNDPNNKGMMMQSSRHSDTPSPTLDSRRKNGPKAWTKEEDSLLLSIVQSMRMPMKWSLVAQNLPERTGKQCRERYVNHLNPRLKITDWSPIEDATIFHLYNTIGSHWAKMSKIIPGRTDNGIKNRFHNLRRQLEREDEHRLRLSAARDFPEEIRLDLIREFPKDLRGKAADLWDIKSGLSVLAAQSVLGGGMSRTAGRFGPFREADTGDVCVRCGFLVPSVQTGNELCTKTGWCQSCARIPPHVSGNMLRECLNLRRCQDTDKRPVVESWMWDDDQGVSDAGSTMTTTTTNNAANGTTTTSSSAGTSVQGRKESAE
jgi:hypothetical protein